MNINLQQAARKANPWQPTGHETVLLHGDSAFKVPHKKELVPVTVPGTSVPYYIKS